MPNKLYKKAKSAFSHIFFKSEIIVDGDVDELEANECSMEQERRLELDQVLHFFVSEYEQESYDLLLSATARYDIEKAGKVYSNLLYKLDHVNEQISLLVDDLTQKRKELVMVATLPDVHQCLSNEIKVIKMDIGEWKRKRYFVRKERKEQIPQIGDLISKAKLLKQSVKDSCSQSLSSSSSILEVKNGESRTRYKVGSDPSVLSYLKPKRGLWKDRFLIRRNVRNYYSDDQLKCLLAEHE
jgi:hypothetical protein